MNENPNCILCALHTSAGKRSVCLKGEGSGTASMLIFLDAPGVVEDKRGRGFVSDGAEFLKWVLKRMSLSAADVYIDYVLKCYPKHNKEFGKKAWRAEYIQACSAYRLATLQQTKPKVIVAMGATAVEAFLGSEKVAQFEGARWIPNEPFVREFVPAVWATYSPAYALQDPSQSVPIYRTLFAAAAEAGLNPTYNPNLKPTDLYGT